MEPFNLYQLGYEYGTRAIWPGSFCEELVKAIRAAGVAGKPSHELERFIDGFDAALIEKDAGVVHQY